MEGFDVSWSIDDRDIAGDFAKELVNAVIPFVVRHHEGMMHWTFSFQPNDFRAATEAFAEVGRVTFV